MGGRGHGARRAFLSGLCPLPIRAPWSGAGQVCGEETKFPAEATAGGWEWAQAHSSELERGPGFVSFYTWPAGVGSHWRRPPRVGDGGPARRAGG